MTAKKSVTKSAEKSATVKRGKPFVANDPRAGRGPKKGAPNAGRPTLEFTAWCKAMLDAPDKRQQVDEVLADKGHPAFATMFRTIADRAHGKAKEYVEHSADESFSALAALAFGRK